jgi:deoxyribonuclease-4
MEAVPGFLKDEGLDAFEYQAVRGVRISNEDATKLGLAAKTHDVQLSFHGPYFINLAGDENTIAASKQRLVASLRAASKMGATQVVFHPGFYKTRTPQEALEMCVDALRDVVQKAKSLGITNVFLGPETTGKPSQVGNLNEIITMCEQVELTRPTIDWAHIHARERGKLKTKGDFLKVMDELEKRLGSEVMKALHCHFTHVEFTDKGERQHHTLDEKEYGPNFQPLAEIIVEQGFNIVVISESPVLDLDSIKMRDLVFQIKARQVKK